MSKIVKNSPRWSWATNQMGNPDLYRQYLLTVMQATDEVNQRRLRESILRSLLESLFAKKDAQRGFSDAQRRILCMPTWPIQQDWWMAINPCLRATPLIRPTSRRMYSPNLPKRQNMVEIAAS